MITVDIENKQAVINWLEQIKSGSGDARPLWQAMTPKITEFVDNQFSDSSANKTWLGLTTRYRTWKAKKGYPTFIGVLTGTLKKGAGAEAIKKPKKKEFIWKVNPSLVESRYDKKLGDYAKYFHGTRPVYDNVTKRTNSFLSTDMKKFSGGSYNSFTYKWLKGALTPK